MHMKNPEDWTVEMVVIVTQVEPKVVMVDIVKTTMAALVLCFHERPIRVIHLAVDRIALLPHSWYLPPILLSKKEV